MTIVFPQKTVGDRILEFLGKKRGIYLPTDVYEKFGPYVYAIARKENFFRALIRPKGAPLPDGMFDSDSLQNETSL